MQSAALALLEETLRWERFSQGLSRGGYCQPELEGDQCHGVMCVNKKCACSKSWVLQVAQPRAQPSESCALHPSDGLVLPGHVSRYVTSSMAAHVGVG